MVLTSLEKVLLPGRTGYEDGPSGDGVEWPSAGPLSRRDRASSRHRRRGRGDPLCARPTATRSASVRGATAGRPVICATAACCSTSAASTTAPSTQMRMTADVGPGKIASVFATELDSQGLFFPTGHCEGIRLGGFLLQGGYGWNSKVLGLACESVLGLEVVTAEGEQIYCDPENHPDMYWAARGAGPGFFGVVTSFKLRIHRRPAVIGTCLYMYPIEFVDEVYTWGREISPEVDDRVELQILATRAYPAAGIDHPTITIASPVFAESEEEAAKALALLGTCPVADKAMINVPYTPTTWRTGTRP